MWKPNFLSAKPGAKPVRFCLSEPYLNDNSYLPCLRAGILSTAELSKALRSSAVGDSSTAASTNPASCSGPATLCTGASAVGAAECAGGMSPALAACLSFWPSCGLPVVLCKWLASKPSLLSGLSSCSCLATCWLSTSGIVLRSDATRCVAADTCSSA